MYSYMWWQVRRFPSCTRLLVSPCARMSPSLLNVHARVDAFVAYNGIIRGYEDIRITSLLGAHSLLSTYFSAVPIYRRMSLTSGFYGMCSRVSRINL